MHIISKAKHSQSVKNNKQMSSLFAHKLDNSTAMLPSNGASNQVSNGVQLLEIC